MQYTAHAAAAAEQNLLSSIESVLPSPTLCPNISISLIHTNAFALFQRPFYQAIYHCALLKMRVLFLVL